MFLNQTAQNIESIINRRRKWFEEEMLKKRQKKVTINYYNAIGWENLPAAGLASLTPYATNSTYKINYERTIGEFATSGKENWVAALFSGYLYIDETMNVICITCDDGCKLFMDDVLVVDNGSMHA